MSCRTLQLIYVILNLQNVLETQILKLNNTASQLDVRIYHYRLSDYTRTYSHCIVDVIIVKLVQCIYCSYIAIASKYYSCTVCKENIIVANFACKLHIDNKSLIVVCIYLRMYLSLNFAISQMLEKIMTSQTQPVA